MTRPSIERRNSERGLGVGAASKKKSERNLIRSLSSEVLLIDDEENDYYIPSEKNGCFKKALGKPKSASVSFSTISTYEHPIILGNNPAVSEGAPVQIDWRAQSRCEIDVDVFESCRENNRRRGKKLVLPVQRRAQILLEAGYSLSDIGSATLCAQQDKSQRLQSAQKQNWDRFQDMLKSTGKSLKKAIKPAKKEESARSA